MCFFAAWQPLAVLGSARTCPDDRYSGADRWPNTKASHKIKVFLFTEGPILSHLPKTAATSRSCAVFMTGPARGTSSTGRLLRRKDKEEEEEEEATKKHVKTNIPTKNLYISIRPPGDPVRHSRKRLGRSWYRYQDEVRLLDCGAAASTSKISSQGRIRYSLPGPCLTSTVCRTPV